MKQKRIIYITVTIIIMITFIVSIVVVKNKHDKSKHLRLANNSSFIVKKAPVLTVSGNIKSRRIKKFIISDNSSIKILVKDNETVKKGQAIYMNKSQNHRYVYAPFSGV